MIISRQQCYLHTFSLERTHLHHKRLLSRHSIFSPVNNQRMSKQGHLDNRERLKITFGKGHHWLSSLD
ncbi:hypothetical protein GBAR_LOCUS29013 [Geodia barretti]|uniref:Uncharacterized protein n=1 Tax=Geodia barretti TaxID=519541 RepID=A0AA35TRC3_GEOBA|nr:hypothetical protein GBAR_LOCUS29013 [Geodia barretti]